MIFKCSECGNTFKVEKLNNEEIIRCPVCEADFKAIDKDGKWQLSEFVYEDDDPGELGSAQEGC